MAVVVSGVLYGHKKSFVMLFVIVCNDLWSCYEGACLFSSAYSIDSIWPGRKKDKRANAWV